MGTTARQRTCPMQDEGGVLLGMQGARPMEVDTALARLARTGRDAASSRAERQAILLVVGAVMLVWAAALAIGSYHYDGEGGEMMWQGGMRGGSCFPPGPPYKAFHTAH